MEAVYVILGMVVGVLIYVGGTWSGYRLRSGLPPVSIPKNVKSESVGGIESKDDAPRPYRPTS